MGDFFAHVPDAGVLLERVTAVCSNRSWSQAHGEHHWQCVARTGLALLEHTPQADPAVVFLFAVFHDSMRVNDEEDPRHGARGAALAARMNGGPFTLTAAQMQTLEQACWYHTDGGSTTDPTIAVCWDADRLNLWRVGIEPDPCYLSTDAAPGLIHWTARLQNATLDWAELHAGYGRAALHAG